MRVRKLWIYFVIEEYVKDTIAFAQLTKSGKYMCSQKVNSLSILTLL